MIYRCWPDSGTISEKEGIWGRIGCRLKIKFIFLVLFYVRLGMFISQSDDAGK